MNHSFRVNIGEVVCEVALPQEVNFSDLAGWYEPFLTDLTPEWDIILIYDVSLRVDQPSRISHDGPLTRFQVMGHQGWVDLEAKRAMVSTPSVDYAHSALMRVISFVIMQELPRRGEGLLLHGAAIVIDGRGHLFFGASGRGKSTVARLASGRGEVLTDENAIIRLSPDEATLYSTPFWGRLTKLARIQPIRRREVPLQALYSLVHATDFSLTRLAPARAVMELLTSEKVATERAESAAAWLAMADKVVERVPLYRLGFRPTVELWDFLAAHEASMEAHS